MEAAAMLNLRQNLTPWYPFGGPHRFSPIPMDQVSWDVEWTSYKPPGFTIPAILAGDKEWADEEFGEGFDPQFNWEDAKVNRKSYTGMYKLDKDGYPLNPMGRTGLSGRGSLGRWGPNHAADCVMTRWKLDDKKEVFISPDDNLPKLEFIAIVRLDTGEVALPGGMVDQGEDPVTAAKREFVEEVLGLEYADLWRDSPLNEDMTEVFSNEKIVDRCYVDDRRNTDNAWIETCAVNFHISSKTLQILHKMKFRSGSDAKSACWLDFNSKLKLYASHSLILNKTVTLLYDEWKKENPSK
ncbi:ADP-ribose pyrophosphatase, mitochondrial isoform X2 [Folsomia candida]|nr:ADP-ribose pyrophosphatase, mitochondrial isoform X2 [Folsomia candida]